MWSVSQSIATLDNLFDRQVIDVVQYLSRLPKGTVPGINKLVAELKQANAAVAAEPVPTTPAVTPSLNPEDVVSSLPPELQQVFSELDPAQAQAALDSAMGADVIADTRKHERDNR